MYSGLPLSRSAAAPSRASIDAFSEIESPETSTALLPTAMNASSSVYCA